MRTTLSKDVAAGSASEPKEMLLFCGMPAGIVKDGIPDVPGVLDYEPLRSYGHYKLHLLFSHRSVVSCTVRTAHPLVLMVSKVDYGRLGLTAIEDLGTGTGCDPGEIQCLLVAQELLTRAANEIGMVESDDQDPIISVEGRADLGRGQRQAIRRIGVLAWKGRKLQARQDYWQFLIAASELLDQEGPASDLRSRLEAAPC